VVKRGDYAKKTVKKERGGGMIKQPHGGTVGEETGLSLVLGNPSAKYLRKGGKGQGALGGDVPPGGEGAIFAMRDLRKV